MNLTEELITLASNKVKNSAGDVRFGVKAGEAISAVGERKLAVISRVLMENKEAVLTQKQAEALKKFCKQHAEITYSEVKKYISLKPIEKKGLKPQKFQMALDHEKMQALCPDMSKADIEDLVYKLLEKWKEERNNSQQ